MSVGGAGRGDIRIEKPSFKRSGGVHKAQRTGAVLSRLTPESVVSETNRLKSQPPVKIRNNLKMILCYIVAGLVGLAVLTVMAAALVATHGAIGAVALAVFSKMGISSTLLSIHAAITPAFISSLSGPVLPLIASFGLAALQSTTLFLLIGGSAGAVYHRNKEKQKDALCPESTARINALEANLKKTLGVQDPLLSEQAIADKERGNRATVLSSLLGKLCMTTKREQSRSGVPNVLKTFAHLVMSGAYGAVQGLRLGKEHHEAVRKNYNLEVDLKNDSVEKRDAGKKALNDLNGLREKQLEQNVWSSDAMAAAYRVAPELPSYDRNICKLQVLKDRVLGSQNLADKSSALKTIDTELQNQIRLRNDLIEGSSQMLDAEEYGALVALDSKDSIKSLLTIGRDIDAIKDLDPEQKGQIKEAVSLLFNRNSQATITDVNTLVAHLAAGVKQGTDAPSWKTRESVMNCALQHAVNIGLKTDTPQKLPQIIQNEVKDPMLYSEEEFKSLSSRLEKMDKAAAIAHASGLPASGFVGTGITLGAMKSLKKTPNGKPRTVVSGSATATSKKMNSAWTTFVHAPSAFHGSTVSLAEP